MLHKMKTLMGAPVAASDGEIGEVEGVFFDDRQWTVRHLVLKTGGGLSGRKVLIAPEALRSAAGGTTLGVALTRHEVMRRPGVDSDMPVSGQYEEASAGFYGHSPDAEKSSVGELRDAERQASRSHLRDSTEVIGYSVHGADGRIGHLDDLVLDDESWRIIKLLVDPGNGRAEHKVEVSPDAVRAIDWKTREVRLASS